MKARHLIKTSVLRSRRVNLFKNHCIPSNVQGACSRTVTLLRLIHEGHKPFNAIRPTTCAISRIKTFAFLISFVLSDDHCYCDHRRQICVTPRKEKAVSNDDYYSPYHLEWVGIAGDTYGKRHRAVGWL